MGHTCFHISTNIADETNYDVNLLSFTAYKNDIENVWKSVFSDGVMTVNKYTAYLSIANKIHVSLLTICSPMIDYTSEGDSSVACIIRNSDADSVLDHTKNTLVSPVSQTAGIAKAINAGYNTMYKPVYLHMITSKNLKTIMLGLSDSENFIGAQVLVSKISNDEYVAIQLNVSTNDHIYGYFNLSAINISNGGNDRYNVYVKDDLKTTSRTQSLYGPGWYITNDILTIIPAIDPWRLVAIPDTYTSIMGPFNKNGLNGVVSIADRKFMTGHVASHNGIAAYPWDSMNNSQVTDGGVITFIEI